MTAQELKNSILQLAIQGKLVKQDPNDEPASVLLEKIKEERKKLIKEKKIKKEKYSEIYKDPSDNHYYEKFEDGTVNDITEEIPFDIPDSWRWVRLKNIARLFSGYAFKGQDLTDTKQVRVIRISDFDDNRLKNNKIVRIDENKIYDKFIIENNSILLAMTGGTVGKSILLKNIKEKMYLNQRIVSISQLYSFICIDYLDLNIQSPYIQQLINDNKNSTNDNISMNLINNFLIPLPPFNEQQQIINKIKNVLLYIEKYNFIYRKLTRLNNSYKEELKKSILQYAIQGKLVKQDPNDEPADVLINKILSEKRELIKSKKIKKENLSVIYKDSKDNQFYEKFDDGTIKNITDEIPFEIPDNWAWTKIKNLSKIITKGSSPSWQGVKYIEKSRNSILFITSENVGKNKIVKDNMKYLEKKFNKIQPRSILEKNDILTNIVGASIGRSCIYDLEYEDTNINQAVCLIRLINKELNNYVLSFLNSPFCYKNLLINSVETARPNISLNTIGNLLIPLPPINEQKEIVLKLNNIIDKLETAE